MTSLSNNFLILWTVLEVLGIRKNIYFREFYGLKRGTEVYSWTGGGRGGCNLTRAPKYSSFKLLDIILIILLPRSKRQFRIRSGCAIPKNAQFRVSAVRLVLGNIVVKWWAFKVGFLFIIFYLWQAFFKLHAYWHLFVYVYLSILYSKLFLLNYIFD